MRFLKFSIATRLLWIFPLYFLLGCSDTPKEELPWEALFNGENLQGWHQLGGEAKYEAKDNSIIGLTVHNTPNSFLVSDRIFSDFILELEVKVDPSMNSGIQIRSNSLGSICCLASGLLVPTSLVAACLGLLVPPGLAAIGFRGRGSGFRS